MTLTKTLLAGLALSTALTGAAFAQEGSNAKNVILLITDGAGINTWRAASYYRRGALGHEVYDDFDVKLFSSTHPLNMSNTPTKSDEDKVTFNPAELWKADKVDTTFEGSLGKYDGFFNGYDYSRAFYTDSAAAATALASGEKTYNNAINWSNDDKKLKHLGEYVVESGRALGVVSSVQWSHATPAGFLGHNPSRNDYVGLGKEIIESGLATVIMGAGHPLFDQNGKPVQPKDDKAYRYVGGKEVWDKLVAGQTDYQLIETRADFEALAAGKLALGESGKVLGTFQNSATSQFNRDGVGFGDKLENSPTLATMTRGALNVISKEEDGFFLMVEGGAVDWAAHANNLPRIIEEQIEFNEAVEAAVEWIEENSSFDDTMIVVTTDHGNGLLQGPNSDEKAYAGIVNQGAGALPLVRWHSDTHTRELVPVYAKGKGSAFFGTVAKQDAGLAAYKVPAEQQFYIDNTDIFRASMNAMGIKEDETLQKQASN
ncbi:alkaline phosphatase [Limoniibacter endophyticus]|uniref:Alkaline phosphatase n=1 Tax=Limoniibacter endophyticus TaxID=1565040 RepID=A0A8J3DR12_9HYPH|nr:alkaline phosphatase [Limoniibacter endophyticus]GHC68378.1 alkaline phosphatase [Limoniibacter endophyticus]